MPYFNVDDLDISPGDFVDACNSREIERLLDELERHTAFKKRYYDIDDTRGDGVRSETHRQFLYHLDYLRKSWLSVSKEDAEIIAILSKKYGAV